MCQGTYADEVCFRYLFGPTSISSINPAEGKQRTLLLLSLSLSLLLLLTGILLMLLSLSWSGLNSRFLFTLNIFSVHLLLTALMAVKISIIQWLKYFIRQLELSSMTYDYFEWSCLDIFQKNMWTPKWISGIWKQINRFLKQLRKLYINWDLHHTLLLYFDLFCGSLVFSFLVAL